MVCFMLAAVSCSKKDDGVSPDSRLCRGESDFGAKILGRSSPVNVCLNEGGPEVSAVFTTPPDRYNILARMVGGEATFMIQISFDHTDDFPRALTPTGSPAELETLPDAVLIYYEETPAAGGATLKSTIVREGTFTLGVSTGDVVTGTFSGLVLDMESGGQPAGRRTLSEGYFSLDVQ